MSTNKNYRYQDKENQIDAIAEQWVNLVFAHLNYKRQNKKGINNHKKENKNGKTRN